MSKLFDALQRTSQANRELLAVFNDGDQPNASTAPPVELPAAAAELQETPAQTPPHNPEYRVESLRLAAGTPTLPFDGSDSRAAEQYRLIRTRILHDRRNPRVLLVSSPTPGDGKTISALNLAAALALKSDSSVLLIDADLRRPAIAQTLGISTEPGLASVLEGTCSLQKAIVKLADINGLYVLPAGRVSVNPSELLDSARWRDASAAIRQLFRFVVIDSPPVSAVADYDLLEKAADGVIVIVRPDHTNRSLARKALESIAAEKQLGVVVNCAVEWAFFRPAHPYYHFGDYH